MPWRDWQFWVVTLLALWGAWMVVRMIVKPFLKRQPPARKAQLTINGKETPKH